jgi:hypothetical protein
VELLRPELAVTAVLELHLALVAHLLLMLVAVVEVLERPLERVVQEVVVMVQMHLPLLLLLEQLTPEEAAVVVEVAHL